LIKIITKTNRAESVSYMFTYHTHRQKKPDTRRKPRTMGKQLVSFMVEEAWYPERTTDHGQATL